MTVTLHFWRGFEKQAEVLGDFSQHDPAPEGGAHTDTIPELGTRFSMTNGQRLDQLTVDSDRGTHEFWKG